MSTAKALNEIFTTHKKLAMNRNIVIGEIAKIAVSMTELIK